MRITHVVATANFAGVERHVAVLAAAQHDAGHTVTVLGGDVDRMVAAIDRPGVGVIAVDGVDDALRRLSGPVGRRADVVATHMTAADIAASLSPGLIGTPIVSTRHFAAGRGSSTGAKAASELAARRIHAEIAVSAFIAAAIPEEATVILPGVANRPPGRPARGRIDVVLMVQRLEAEKDSAIGLSAFATSGLTERGWRLAIAGDGSLRSELESRAAELGISESTDFLGHRDDIADLMDKAAIFLAPAPAEPMGLSVLEAMASGLPVVAAGAGGHLESVGPVPGAALLPVGNPTAAGALLADLAADPDLRDAYGAALRERQRTAFAISTQAEATEALYRHAIAEATSPLPAAPAATRELVVISLEPWDEVWRRNQHLVAGLLRADPGLRILFVEPASDPVHAVRLGARPRRGLGLRRGPHLSGIDPDALWLHQPTKVLPRRVDPGQDRRWAEGVRRAADRLGFRAPMLWVNDPGGAEVLTLTGWPALYDITDDWLEADRDEATHTRLVRQEAVLMRDAVEVVVCSPGLERTKSPQRPVTLLQNAVDAEAARVPTARPGDLPTGPLAVYVGTLHGDRLDVDLCEETATRLPDGATLVLVGPNALTPAEDARLEAAGVMRLGAKDRHDVPAYLQHADVLVVPHVVDDFTESLDPIKLYEYRAVGRPVVSTPVSGFREAAGPRVAVVDRNAFADAVAAAVPARDTFPTGVDADVPTWADRVGEMSRVIDRVAATTSGEADVPLDARVALGHAAIQWLADAHGVDLLHIKGQALDASLLYPGRQASDIDVLVRPSHVDRFLHAAAAAGFEVVGRFATSSAFEHSATLRHPHWGLVDVHRLFPGFGLPPADAFDVLWADRTTKVLGGHRCTTPAVAAQVVILVVHAARNVNGGQSTADVTHSWHGADAAGRARVHAQVERLRAQVAFAAGTGDLEGLPPTPEHELWSAVARRGDRIVEWRARIAAAPDLRSRARIVARLPLVNTDHLAMQHGRRPTRREIAREFVHRAQRGVREIRAMRRRPGGTT
ncbi:glycosyltransferase [Janibacter sp. G56]|uniref:glycosyltransferase n=1 Tax=Janibacter sp. G56 TaxID=3418717 RepID=UPI003CFD9306